MTDAMVEFTYSGAMHIIRACKVVALSTPTGLLLA